MTEVGVDGDQELAALLFRQANQIPIGDGGPAQLNRFELPGLGRSSRSLVLPFTRQHQKSHAPLGTLDAAPAPVCLRRAVRRWQAAGRAFRAGRLAGLLLFELFLLSGAAIQPLLASPAVNQGTREETNPEPREGIDQDCVRQPSS